MELEARSSSDDLGAMWASAYSLWAHGVSGEADATNSTAMLEAFLTQQLRAYDWILMFNCTFYLGAVLHLFQPSYDWTCVMSAQVGADGACQPRPAAAAAAAPNPDPIPNPVP
mgnify:CR=1 FL=1